MTDATKKKIIKWFWICIIVPVLMVIGLLALVWVFADIPSFEELENPDSKLATQVIAEDGEILTTFHIENRSYVTFEELSPNLVQAAIATEDVRFHNHSGIDFRALARVAFKTVLGGNSGQGGGSTITQQLAKTLYPRQDVSSKIPGVSTLKMVWIKLKEWITAVKLERNYTKDEIMNMYMNQVFFGSNAYGIKAAAQHRRVYSLRWVGFAHYQTERARFGTLHVGLSFSLCQYRRSRHQGFSTKPNQPHDK